MLSKLNVQENARIYTDYWVRALYCYWHCLFGNFFDLTKSHFSFISFKCKFISLSNIEYSVDVDLFNGKPIVYKKIKIREQESKGKNSI